MRGSGGGRERAARWKSEPGGRSTKDRAVPSRSDLFLRVLEHFHGLLHLPFLVALLQQPVTGTQVAQELQKKTTWVNPTSQTQGASAFRSPLCHLPGTHSWGGPGPPPSCPFPSDARPGWSVCQQGSHREKTSSRSPPLSQGGNGNKAEGGRGANRTSEPSEIQSDDLQAGG